MRMNRARTADTVKTIAKLASDIVAGDRRALARAITLVESTKEGDQNAAESLLMTLLPKTGRSIRIGISGAPGVGKSTFIETFGQHLSELKRRIAVLAIDPTSRRSGGSILGDKTRMEKLSRDPNAYIRPSPAGTTLGGVARRTRESMLVAEAAGFDVVLVETVGIGQSETAVADMTDLFVVLVAPAGGDDLQGIKRGVMELADLLIVTKADGELLPVAKRTEADYRMAMHLMQPKHVGLPAHVISVSARENSRISDAWSLMEQLYDTLRDDGRLVRNREAQLRRWFWSEVHAAISENILSRRALMAAAKRFESEIAEGNALPTAAARELVREMGN
jgi:GTPase